MKENMVVHYTLLPPEKCPPCNQETSTWKRVKYESLTEDGQKMGRWFIISEAQYLAEIEAGGTQV